MRAVKRRVLIAFSGGPDSTYLLHYLLRKLGRENVGICYVNHLLRESAFEEERRVRSIGEEMGIFYCTVRVRVREFAKRKGLSIEEAGRILRYRVLKRVALRNGFRYIATGHNLNDAFETFLLNSIKGTGPMGLVLPPRRGRIIRPLILVEKAKIEERLRRGGIHYVVDETNLEDKFERNYIRLRVEKPLLKRFPMGLSGFRRTYRNLVSTYRYHLREIRSLFRKALIYRSRAFYLLRADILRGETYWGPLLLSRILPDITRRHIDDAMEVIRKGGKLNVPGNIFLHSAYGLLAIYRRIPSLDGIHFIYPGTASINLHPMVRLSYYTSSTPRRGRGIISIPVNRVAFPLKIRSRRRGDRAGSKKLKELLIGRKVHPVLREVVPVVESNGEILFVPGVYSKKFSQRDSLYLIIRAEGILMDILREGRALQRD